jgi:signal transduction histidine kinase
MMGWARERGLWLTTGVLALLLVLLAVLQYRWIGEIGRAEAERRRAQAERLAARFAANLDKELGRAILALRVEPGPDDETRRARLVERLAAWRRDEHAALASAVLLAARRGEGPETLERCSAEAGCASLPPTSIDAPLRDRLRELLDGGGREGFPFRPAVATEQPPCLLLPLFEVRDEDEPASRHGRFRINGVLVIPLDADYLRERLLPQLAETTFGPTADSEFVAAVISRRDRTPLFTSATSERTPPARPGDVELPLPFGGRLGRDDRGEPGRRPGPLFETRRESLLDSPRPHETEPAGASAFAERPRPPREEGRPWLLVVTHRGGSLEQVVAAVRRRNLAVGLGLLALLGGVAFVLASGAERARALARQQLEFVAGVTHELNTPLAAIRSAGQNLADGIVTDPQQVRRYGGLIEKEGRRLTSLVAQVLDFAGIESAGRAYAAEPVALARVIDEVVQDMRLVLDQSGLTLTSEVPASLPDVIGDSAALRRVLANLLTNAVKFAASGRRVRLKATALAERRSVELRVEDNGPGIPAQERARVFEPFYRGAAAQRNERPGSGLGLSLVRRVVAAHGGRVRIEDAAGGGTAVVIELPVAEALPASAAVEESV